jgi:DUF4097 and DUF4098 domain-containing protein YvlB
MRQQFAVSAALEASTRLGNGRVTVERAEDGVAWAAVEAADSASEASVELAARATISLLGNQLVVDVPDSGRLFRRAELAVTFGLPPQSGLSVKGGMVDVTVRGGVAALAVKLGTGDVDVDEATSAVAVKAGQTNVVLGRAGTVAVSTGQGSLRADDVGVTAFKTGQGTVHLGRTAGAVAVKGGSVDLTVQEAGPGEIAFTAGAGSASVGVAAGTTVELDLLSGAGDVRCDLPLEASAPSGGAALRVRLKTGSGNLSVSPAAAVPS